MKLILLLALTLSLQAKECSILLETAVKDLKKSYIGGKDERSLKTMYAVRSMVSLELFKLCIDVEDYEMKDIKEILRDNR